jgi:hypothetical protein
VGVATVSGGKLVGVKTIRGSKFSVAVRGNHETYNDAGFGDKDVVQSSYVLTPNALHLTLKRR